VTSLAVSLDSTPKTKTLLNGFIHVLSYYLGSYTVSLNTQSFLNDRAKNKQRDYFVFSKEFSELLSDRFLEMKPYQPQFHFGEFW